MKGTFLYWAWGFALAVVLLVITVVVYQSLTTPPYFVRAVARGEPPPAPPVTRPSPLHPPHAMGRSAGDAQPSGGFPLPGRSQRYLTLLVDSLDAARTQEPRRTTAVLEELQRLDAPDPRIYRWLGAIYHREGNYPAAAAAFERAVELAPGHATDLFNLATIYLLQERYPRAIRTFNRVLPLQPPFLDDVYAYLGYCLMAMGEEAKARRAWEVCLQLDPANAVARRYMAPAATLGLLHPGADVTPLRPAEEPRATVSGPAGGAQDRP
jgi:tetratricopeptide (TPR) repeat protein